VLDINQVVGKFNEITEGKVLIVLDEVDGKKVNILLMNKLKGFLTRDTQQIQVKHKGSHGAQNVTNLILSTNEETPVHIPAGDRHYCVLKVNPIHVQDRVYFGGMREAMGIDFYENLLTYFMTEVDVKNFALREVLFTKEKLDLIEVCADDVQKWCVKFYDRLSGDGMTNSEVSENKIQYMKDRQFRLKLSTYCEVSSTHRTINYVRTPVRVWKLKSEYKRSLKRIVEMKASSSITDATQGDSDDGGGGGSDGDGEESAIVPQNTGTVWKKGPADWNRRGEADMWEKNKARLMSKGSGGLRPNRKGGKGGGMDKESTIEIDNGG
jgi:hypothetical protein